MVAYDWICLKLIPYDVLWLLKSNIIIGAPPANKNEFARAALANKNKFAGVVPGVPVPQCYKCSDLYQ